LPSPTFQQSSLGWRYLAGRFALINFRVHRCRCSG
jgi:hypothetical protein